jgi:lysyl-tRNA synthetase, class I
MGRQSLSEVPGGAPRRHGPEDGAPQRHGPEDWADELAASVSGPQVVNDSKTPSGTVHVGSLRGPVILDVIVRALRRAGNDTTLLYGVDDMDPMDAQALLTPDAVDHEMGRPLAHVPDQSDDGHASYARHHAQVFIDIFAGLGIHPDRYYWMSEIYPTGQMDGFIRTALDRAADVREIYRRVANVQHPDNWHPIQVVCPNCGKIGTTIVTQWDGERVFFECRENLVTWARGCGTSGWITPFGGTGKLGWNLEWAAQWSLFGVTIEPCGKDLSTAGGSRDRADAIAREIFDREPPLNVPYEFLNIGGKKMSTSKGRGAAAHEIADVVPPEQLRFLFIRPRPNQAIEFEPEGSDAIPRLFDEFDKFAAATAGREVRGEIAPGHAATFAYSLLDPAADVAAEAVAFRPAFSHLALLAQIPNVDVRARVEAEKGSELSGREDQILDERVKAARSWLEAYAPERAVVAVRDALPADAVAVLDDDQRRYLGALADAALSEEAPPASGEAWQNLIFAVAGEAGLPNGRAFAALYAAFLGRTNGPRAGWLLASLDPTFVTDRLRTAATPQVAA